MNMSKASGDFKVFKIRQSSNDARLFVPAHTRDADLSRSMRHLRNDTLKHIGEQSGIDKYSTFSSIAERVKYEMKADRGLKKRIQKLAENITKSQRQT